MIEQLQALAAKLGKEYLTRKDIKEGFPYDGVTGWQDFNLALMDWKESGLYNPDSIEHDMKHADFRVDGQTHITNTSGIQIMLNTREDEVYFRFVIFGEDINEQEIFCTNLIDVSDDDNDDEEYEPQTGFRHGEIVYHLNDFMRP